MTNKARSSAKKPSNKGANLSLVSPTEPKAAGVVRTFNVLYQIPRSARTKIENGSPTKIVALIGRQCLTITGSPEMLASVGGQNGDKIRGTLTLTSSPSSAKVLTSATLEIGTDVEPDFRLHAYANLDENYSFSEGETGVMYRYNSCIVKLTNAEKTPVESQQLAA